MDAKYQLQEKLQKIHANLIEPGQGLRIKSRKSGNEELAGFKIGESIIAMCKVDNHSVPMQFKAILGFVLCWDEHDIWVEAKIQGFRNSRYTKLLDELIHTEDFQRDFPNHELAKAR